jgi:hypothetical protein
MNLSLDSDVQALAEANDAVDRLQEFKELPLRHDLKLDPEYKGVPTKLVTPSRLKYLRLLMKMGNRPKFTTAASLVA